MFTMFVFFITKKTVYISLYFEKVLFGSRGAEVWLGRVEGGDCRTGLGPCSMYAYLCYLRGCRLAAVSVTLGSEIVGTRESVVGDVHVGGLWLKPCCGILW